MCLKDPEKKTKSPWHNPPAFLKKMSSLDWIEDFEVECHVGCIQQDSLTCHLFWGGARKLSGPAAQKIVTAGIASFLTGGVKNLVTGGHGNGGLKVACPTENLYAFVRMYGSKALGFWCDQVLVVEVRHRNFNASDAMHQFLH